MKQGNNPFVGYLRQVMWFKKKRDIHASDFLNDSPTKHNLTGFMAVQDTTTNCSNNLIPSRLINRSSFPPQHTDRQTSKTICKK